MDIQEVINQYFEASVKTSLEQHKEGTINLTYHLTAEEGGVKKDYKLQKMNAIFNVSLMEDIDFITKYLTAGGFTTPEVVRTLKGTLFVKDGTSWWRVLTYLPGKTFFTIESSDQAREAGQLVGRFHTTLLDCNYKFRFKLPHYRGTDFFMKELNRILIENRNTTKYAELGSLAENIISAYKKLSEEVVSPGYLPHGDIKTSSVLPERIIHGDLKINHIVFDEAGTKAVGLVDIDTFMYGTIPVELGDALRSWSMPGGEDADKVEFSKEFYNAALEGYGLTAKFITSEEQDFIPYGVKLLTLELAARFAADAFNESYFTLDSSKYKNLFEQNKKKAQNQFEFFKEFSKVF